MPLFVLQAFSRFVYLVIFYLVGYRKKVVEINLRNSFPEKNDQEIHKVLKGFYKHFCDIFIETVYMLKISRKEGLKRYEVVNADLINSYYAKGKDIVVATSHYANWEWASIGWDKRFYKLYGIYKPLSNKLFDRFMVHLRSVHGNQPVPMKNTLRTIIEAQKKNERFAIYLVGDQRPMKSEIQHWLTFMNQDTPVITGPEKIARKFNAVFAFLDIEQVKRGYYKVTWKIISDEPAKESEFALTEKFFQLIEEQIRREPELYLWSHKRWKFKRKDIIGNS
jgi:Kdo2-lipid IVA lauroyltransferase/acyltransferase